jgi:NDP-sugar pyrophosphorylase family protein
VAKRAVILAGGKGTRLRPFTITLPKPLVPVNEQPILELILKQLKKNRFERVTLAVNHFASLIEAYCGNGARWGLVIDYSLEEMPLGTIGPLRRIPDLPENFLVMNGDVLTDLDFAWFLDEHQRNKCDLTIAAARREQTLDFGALTTGADGRLISFEEKPRLSHLVSMGIYGVNRSLIDQIPADRPVGVDDVACKLLDSGAAVHVTKHTGYWFDLGKPEDFEKAQSAISEFAENDRIQE